MIRTSRMPCDARLMAVSMPAKPPPTPYRAPNMPLSNITELLALPGMTRANFDRLAPYVTALPPGQPLNLCTAPGAVLDALIPGQEQFSLDEPLLLERRQGGCFPTLLEFQTQMSAAQLEDGYWRAYRRFYSWSSILRGASHKETPLRSLRHIAYSGGWKKFEGLWNGLTRASIRVAMGFSRACRTASASASAESTRE